MNAIIKVLGCLLVTAGCFCVALGMSVPEVMGSSPNDTCCTPARVDQPSSPGGCDPCDECESCHENDCSVSASLVAVDGSCDEDEGSVCSMGTGLRTISTGFWTCDPEAYPDCECEYVSHGQPQQVTVKDCSGDHC